MIGVKKYSRLFLKFVVTFFIGKNIHVLAVLLFFLLDQERTQHYYIVEQCERNKLKPAFKELNRAMLPNNI